MKNALSTLLDQALRAVAGEYADSLRFAGLEQARDSRNGHYAISAASETCGSSNTGNNRSVLVEFVSANPTGPLHVGHGRSSS